MKKKNTRKITPKKFIFSGQKRHKTAKNDIFDFEPFWKIGKNISSLPLVEKKHLNFLRKFKEFSEIYPKFYYS